MVANNNGLTIQASDVSGQRQVRVSDVPRGGTVGELVTNLLNEMELIDQVDGRPLAYSARLEREGRHLHAAERVEDALQQDDRIVLAPNIDAG